MYCLYFAYGSNMHPQRMRERTPSARYVAVGWVPGWCMVCNKRGRDGSAKANLIPQAGAQVWGVVYRVDRSEMRDLDRTERDYLRRPLPFLGRDGEAMTVDAYVSRRLTDHPVPRAWYKELMVQGARHHGLPGAYIDFLEGLPQAPDPGDWASRHIATEIREPEYG